MAVPSRHLEPQFTIGRQRRPYAGVGEQQDNRDRGDALPGLALGSPARFDSPPNCQSNGDGSATTPHIAVAVDIRISSVRANHALGVAKGEPPASFDADVEVKALRHLESKLPAPLGRIVKPVARASGIKPSRADIDPASFGVVLRSETVQENPNTLKVVMVTLYPICASPCIAKLGSRLEAAFGED